MVILGTAFIKKLAKDAARATVAELRRDRRSTEARPNLPHDRGFLAELPQRLGIEPGATTETKLKLKRGTADKTEAVTLVDANAATRTTVLRSKTAQKIVDLAKSGLDATQTQILEDGLLAELRSELPQTVALHLETGDYIKAREAAQGNQAILEKIDFNHTLNSVLQARRELTAISPNNQAYAGKVANYQKTLLDLAEALIDPQSKPILGARNHTELETIESSIPNRSKYRNSFDQLSKGDNFHKALHDYLTHLGIANDLSSLKDVLKNPYDNAQHPLITDNNRQGLRLILANDIIRKENHRIKNDTVCPGFLGSLREMALNSGFKPVEISKDELNVIYGKDSNGVTINKNDGYTFKLDTVAINLMAGKTGAPASGSHSLYTTKSGAVIQLLETYAVLEKRLYDETDPSNKKAIAHQKELLKSLITDSGSLMPPAVYQQIQHVLNNEPMALYGGIRSISQQMAQTQTQKQIDEEVAKLSDKYDGIGNFFTGVDRLTPEAGNPGDPRSFFVATMNVIKTQANFTQTAAQDVIAGLGTHANEISDSLKANTQRLQDLLESSVAGVATPGTVEALYASLLHEDKRISISDTQNHGPLNKLLFHNHQKFDPVQLKNAIENGSIKAEDLWLDQNNPDRKIMGLGYLFERIDSSNFDDAVKVEAKQKVLKAILGDDTKTQETLSALNISTGINDQVSTLSQLEATSLDTLKSLHNVITTNDQSRALFMENFLKGFTKPGDFPAVIDTWKTIAKAAESVDFSDPTRIEEQLQQLSSNLRALGKESVAKSVQVMYEPFGFNQEASALRIMLDFIKALGFGDIINSIERFLNVSAQKTGRSEKLALAS